MVCPLAVTDFYNLERENWREVTLFPLLLVLVLSSHVIKNMTWRGGVMGWRWETKWRTRSESYVYTRARERGDV